MKNREIDFNVDKMVSKSLVAGLCTMMYVLFNFQTVVLEKRSLNIINLL